MWVGKPKFTVYRRIRNIWEVARTALGGGWRSIHQFIANQPVSRSQLTWLHWSRGSVPSRINFKVHKKAKFMICQFSICSWVNDTVAISQQDILNSRETEGIFLELRSTGRQAAGWVCRTWTSKGFTKFQVFWVLDTPTFNSCNFRWAQEKGRWDYHMAMGWLKFFLLVLRGKEI